MEHLTSGPCIAIEVRGEDVVRRFREFCGPIDPGENGVRHIHIVSMTLVAVTAIAKERA